MRLISAAFLFLLTVSAYGQTQNADNPELKAAIKLSTNEQFEDAENAFKALLDKNPNNGEVSFYYGYTIINEYLADTVSNSVQETADRAGELFHNGIKTDSLNPYNYVGMGMITLLQYSDTTKADVFFRKAESFIPRKKKMQSTRDVNILTLMGTAQMYGHNQRLYKANYYFERAKAIQPMNASIYLAWGDVYMKLNDAQNAIMNYNKALALDKTSPLPKIRIGDIYMKVPNLNAARPLFEEAMQIDSTFAPVYREMGELYTLAGRYDLAKENYKKFLDLSGNNIPAKTRYAVSLYRSRDYKGALEQIEEIQKVDKSRNYLNRIAGYCCYDMRPPEIEKGIAYMQEFFKNAKPKNIFSRDYAYYGRLQYRHAKNDSVELAQAFSNLNKAYEMDTNDLTLVNEMAQAYYYARWYPQSIAMYEKKIEHTPKSNMKVKLQDMMQIAKMYYMMGDYGKADTAFMAVTALEPDNIQAYLFDARSMAALEQKQSEGKYNTLDVSIAKPKFDLLIQKVGSDTVKYEKELEEAFNYMGSMYIMFLKEPDYEQAFNWFNRLYNLDPSNKATQIKALKAIALIRYKEKKYRDARDYYLKVKAMDPNDADVKKVLSDLDKAIKAQEAQNNR